MAVSPAIKNIIAITILTIDGVELKAKVQKCAYVVERSLNPRGDSGGIISLELIFDVKSKELPQLLTDNEKAFTGVITCKTTSGDLVRTITFYDALSKSFSEAIDVKTPTALVSMVQLQATRISVT